MGKAILERTTFSTARSAEYFSQATLQTMTGQPSARFVAVLLKELMDNGLDAAEKANVAPNLVVGFKEKRRHVVLTVIDNGGGIDPGTVKKVLDFSTLTSDKAAYCSPTRGAQGNALKTVLGIPYALGGRKPVIIEALGVRHVIHVRVVPGGEVVIDDDTSTVAERPGTRVLLCLPKAACAGLRFGFWAKSYALFNPHASVHFCKITQTGNHMLTPPRAKPGKCTKPRSSSLTGHGVSTFLVSLYRHTGTTPTPWGNSSLRTWGTQGRVAGT